MLNPSPATSLAPANDDCIIAFAPFESMPSRLLKTHIDDILIHCVEQDASDITFQTNEPVWADAFGRQHAVTDRVLHHHELEMLAIELYGNQAVSYIKSGNAIDVAYALRKDRRTTYRFRVNITGVFTDHNEGLSVSCRALPELPPSLDDLGIEAELRAAFNPVNGLVLVTGPTGSGKSTLLAAMIGSKLLDPKDHCKILAYEAPIEFVYHGIEKNNGYIGQTEIPTNLRSFADAVRNSLRRRPTDILIGECRDAETLGAAVEAALTGHTLYTTLHSSGVAETVQRIVATFPAEERQSRCVDVIQSLRLIVTQALLPTLDGKRIACREYLMVEAEVRQALLSAPLEAWPRIAEEAMQQFGRPMMADVEAAYAAGRIDAQLRDAYGRKFV